MKRAKNVWVAGLFFAAGCGSADLVGRVDSPPGDGVGDASVSQVSISPDVPPRDTVLAPIGTGVAMNSVDGGVSPAYNAAPSPLCEAHAVQSSRSVPEMLIVLDRSFSMGPDGNETFTDRWQGSVAAIEQVTQKFDGLISFGLMTFPGLDERQLFPGRASQTLEIQCPAGTLEVPIGPVRSRQIASALDGLSPGGSTPTASTLQALLTLLGQAPNVETSPALRYVLLVTDGDPNCEGPAVNGADPLARRLTLNAIEALSAAQVRTFVVGFQTARTSFAEQLDQMAALGGTGETRHRSVENGDDLADTFQEIADRAASCSYRLEAPVKNPSYVLVKVADTPKALRDANGWTLGSDMQTVTLLGAACESVRNGAPVTVKVECAPVILL